MKHKKIALLIAAVIVMSSFDTIAISNYNTNDVKAVETVGIAPELTYDTNGYVEGETSTKDVHITLGNSASSAGPTKYFYMIDGKIKEAVDGKFDVTANGKHQITCYAQSADGLLSTKHLIFVNIDKVYPDLTYDTNGYVMGTYSNKPVRITLGNSAPNQSDVKYFYRINNCEIHEAENNEIIIDNTSENAIAVWAQSASGLMSAQYILYVNVDNYVPALDLKEISQSDNSHVIQYIAASGLTGIDKITVSKDGGEDTDVSLETYNYPVTENGHYKFTILGTNGLSSTSEIDITDIPTANNGSTPDNNSSQSENGTSTTTKTGDVSSLGLVILSLGSMVGIKMGRKRK